VEILTKLVTSTAGRLIDISITPNTENLLVRDMEERVPISVRSCGSDPTTNRDLMLRVHESVTAAIQAGFVIESKEAVVYQL
jgi:hypothetical protein